MKKRILTIAAALILFTAYVSTTNAQSTDKCADWGYINTPEQCIDAGEGILKCPLDPTKIYCPTPVIDPCAGKPIAVCNVEKLNLGNCKEKWGDGCDKCKTCYTCADGGYTSDKPDGAMCLEVPYQGLTCYKDCQTEEQCIANCRQDCDMDPSYWPCENGDEYACGRREECKQQCETIHCRF